MDNREQYEKEVKAEEQYEGRAVSFPKQGEQKYQSSLEPLALAAVLVLVIFAMVMSAMAM